MSTLLKNSKYNYSKWSIKPPGAYLSKSLLWVGAYLGNHIQSIVYGILSKNMSRFIDKKGKNYGNAVGDNCYFITSTIFFNLMMWHSTMNLQARAS